jgi:DNA (cytosine-5)-methyltransferase 1
MRTPHDHPTPVRLAGRGKRVKPRLLDLFCGAGGCSVGYARAGFEVVGIDIAEQPNYPFEVWQTDALEVLEAGKVAWRLIEDFDAIHASPPCQAFTAYKRRPNHVKESPDLIAPTRELLEATGLPWIMENVAGAPLRDPLMLCGSMFDPPLDVRRHRYFESNVPLHPPAWGCRHRVWGPRFPSATNRRKNSRLTVQVGSWNTPLEVQKRAMGIDWMTLEELSEAIPPAYCEHIGGYLMAHLNTRKAAA